MNDTTPAEALSPQHSDSAAKAEKSYFRVVIRAPIHKVWAELTRTDAVLPFFFNAVCKTTKLGVKAPVRMRSKDGKYTSVVGEVLEFEPPYRYSHTFQFTNFDDPPCIVRYVLKEVDGGTEFTLINENVPAGTKTEKYMTQGGTFITEDLKAIVETGKPTAGGRFALFMMGLFAPFTPKKCQSENWPL
jgi:uncharacterized protein YndB with AHSA1/START domain